MNASLDPPAPGRTRFLPGRARPVHGLASVLAAVLAFGPTVALSSPLATLPTIYVTYTTDCTFTMSADGGIEISSPTAPGVVIPPGSYQVVVSQGYALSPGAPRCPPSTYELTGPGVSLSFVVGEGSPYEQAVASFAPSSTFVAVVEDAPLAQLVFTTAATGSSSSLLSPTQAPAAGTAQTQPGLVGSQISSGRGTLRATVGRSGKATLSAHGRSVVSLAAGVYESWSPTRARTPDSRSRSSISGRSSSPAPRSSVSGPRRSTSPPAAGASTPPRAGRAASSSSPEAVRSERAGN